MKVLISTNTAGLSNRLLNWAYNDCISELHYDDHKLYWQKTFELNASFDQLYSNKNLLFTKKDNNCKYHTSGVYSTFLPLYIFNKNEKKNKYDIFYPELEKIITESENTHRIHMRDDKYKNNNQYYKIINYKYNMIPKNILQKISQKLKSLNLIKDLQKMIDNYSENFDDMTISIHIRSWQQNMTQDISKENLRRRKFYDLPKVIKIMKILEQKGHNFYITSDMEDSLNEIKQKFNKELNNTSGVVHIFPRKTSRDNSRCSLTGIQEDLIELYLLSKNKWIIGSYLSTYSELAWYLGECKSKIFII